MLWTSLFCRLCVGLIYNYNILHRPIALLCIFQRHEHVFPTLRISNCDYLPIPDKYLVIESWSFNWEARSILSVIYFLVFVSQVSSILVGISDSIEMSQAVNNRKYFYKLYSLRRYEMSFGIMDKTFPLQTMEIIESGKHFWK